jgi:HAD superfamily hydrolase (TIGR01509 family)
MTNHAILLDLDGTLVDSVYHHVAAWSAAFADHGYDVPDQRIHAGIGMGGDRLVAWLVGEEPDDADTLREAHTERFLDRVGALRPTPGALALLDDLERRERGFVVATSASPTEREALLEVLGRPDLPVTDNDESIASKPAPDLLLDACAMLDADPTDATLVGDSPWDARAAGRVGMRTIAVRCGGFGDAVLTAAGAVDVVDAPRDLVGRL